MTYRANSDQAELIVRAARGDGAAEHALYEAYREAAYRLAYLLLGDGGDAEEVVQDAFVYALTNLWRYDEERGTFWAWLRVIIVSRSRNKRRRRQLTLVPLEVLGYERQADVDPAGHDPAERMVLAQTRRAIWEALRRVSPGARDAIVLRFYEGLPYRDIANVLGCSPDAARARVAHGKAQLRRLLMDDDCELSPLATLRTQKAG